MEQIEAKLNPSVVLIIDDDDQRAREVGEALRRAFGQPSIRVRRWSDLAGSAGEAMVDLAILGPRAESRGEESRSLPDLLAELKHIPTIVLASAGDPQAAVNAVLEGASDALVMQEAYLDLLPTRVSKTLARAHFRAATDRRRAERPSALQRTREENRRLRTRLSSLRVAAMLDPLTGLYNRRALDARLAEMWDAAVVSGGELSCLVIDVDHFKRVNDTLGHAVGDLMLTVLARVLTEQCRQEDIAARLGGDEFAAVLASASAEQARLVAQRIQTAFNAAAGAALGGRPAGDAGTGALRLAGNAAGAGPPTLSIGVSSRIVNRPTCAADLVVHADIALYQSKQEGRDRVSVAGGRGAPARGLASAG